MNAEYWEKRRNITEQEVENLDLDTIERRSDRLRQGEVYMYDIPVESFYGPNKGFDYLRGGVLPALIDATKERLLKEGKQFNVAGGTWCGIERGIIHVRRDS